VPLGDKKYENELTQIRVSFMNSNQYTTTDFQEAVILRYSGHKLTFVDKSQKRAVFHFDHSFDTDQILEEYRNRQSLVEPQAFYLCQREIKGRLYSN
jgi:hypothetical protein